LTTTWTEPPRDWTGGELVTEAIMDAHVREQFKATWHLITRKPSDEAVTSSTVLQDDDHLFAPVLANEVWALEWRCLVTGATAGDWKIAWTFPGGTFSCNFTDVLSDGTYRFFQLGATASPTGTLDCAALSTTVPKLQVMPVIYSNGGSAGNVQLQWAQNASSGTATTMKANSTIWGCKLA